MVSSRFKALASDFEGRTLSRMSRNVTLSILPSAGSPNPIKYSCYRQQDLVWHTQYVLKGANFCLVQGTVKAISEFNKIKSNDGRIRLKSGGNGYSIRTLHAPNFTRHFVVIIISEILSPFADMPYFESKSRKYSASPRH